MCSLPRLSCEMDAGLHQLPWGVFSFSLGVSSLFVNAPCAIRRLHHVLCAKRMTLYAVLRRLAWYVMVTTLETAIVHIHRDGGVMVQVHAMILDPKIGEIVFTMEASYFHIHLHHIERHLIINEQGFNITKPAGSQTLLTFTIPDTTSWQLLFCVIDLFVDMHIRCVNGMPNCATTHLLRSNKKVRGLYFVTCQTIGALLNRIQSKGKEEALSEVFLLKIRHTTGCRQSPSYS